jgi:hypothetical protein
MSPLETLWMVDLGLECVKECRRAVDGVLDVLETGVSAEQVLAVAQAAVTVAEVLAQLDEEREEEA